jgi:predicted N-acetyltransferase YhbS
MTSGRPLTRDEIEDVWTLDRSERVENVYRLAKGELRLERVASDLQGWPPGEAAKYTPLLVECFDRGGWFHGLFDGASLVGVAVLDAKFLGPSRDLLQLKFLHVGQARRRQGLGSRLFGLARREARARGARRLYVSATPTENTVDFYLRLGCVLAREVDPELYALEPEDIHLECDV